MSRGTEIAERIRVGHDEVFGLLDGLTDEQLTQPGFVGEQSLKDLIGHIGTSEWFAEEFLRTRAWPVMPSEINRVDLDERNAAIYRWLKDRPLDQIRVDEAGAYAGLLEVVGSLDDADFDDPARLGLPEGPAWRPEAFVAGSTNDHYREHIDDVRRWVEELTAGAEQG